MNPSDDAIPAIPGKAETLASVLKQFGEPSAVFKPSPTRMGLVALVGLALCAIGLAIAVRYALGFSDTSKLTHPRLERWGMATIGSLVASVGLGLLLWAWGKFGYRLLVCPAGFIRVHRQGIDAFPWADMKLVRLTIIRHKVAEGPSFLVPTSRADVFLVIRQDDASIAFDRDDVMNAELLGELLQAEARRHQIPWEVVETSY